MERVTVPYLFNTQRNWSVIFLFSCRVIGLGKNDLLSLFLTHAQQSIDPASYVANNLRHLKFSLCFLLVY